MIAVFVVYLISILAWGYYLFQLIRLFRITKENKSSRPPLLVPLFISSFSIFLESVYFGISSFFKLVGYSDLFLWSLEGENWFLIKLFIAVSGVVMVLSLKQKR